MPEIFNTDQGSQFTSDEFVQVLMEHHIQISMDGKGRALDNIFVERLWRSFKYEHIYLNVYENGISLWGGLVGYFEFYNNERLHQSLEYLRGSGSSFYPDGYPYVLRCSNGNLPFCKVSSESVYCP